MRPRALVGIGLLYVAMKWTVILSVGAWAIERGHPQLILAFPTAVVTIALLTRRIRRPHPDLLEVSDD